MNKSYLHNPISYKQAGVDIKRADRFAEFIKNIKSKAINQAGGLFIGGFSGGMELNIKSLKNPILLCSTDGVGSKLLIAKYLKKYSTIGQDLVAMCVNDLLVCGAEPLMFLDYIACGCLDEKIMQSIIKGIVKGCELAGCQLAGGETAELPDMYAEGDFDLAGFVVGIVEKQQMLPQLDFIKENDIILGLPSSGIHSNGLSLARKVIPQSDKTSWQEMLIPTRIYLKQMKIMLKTGKILAAAHITGGGLYGNLQRVIPCGLKLHLDFSWQIPSIFKTIQKQGNITDNEMKKVFNMGIGIALVVKKDSVDYIIDYANNNDIEIIKIGKLIS